jgi:hypothetical protein
MELRVSRSERMDDAATEEALEKVVQLFAFITDKDLFGEIYRWEPCVEYGGAVRLDKSIVDGLRLPVPEITCPSGY